MQSRTACPDSGGSFIVMHMSKLKAKQDDPGISIYNR